MGTLPGTVALGKFRIIYEEERQRSSSDAHGYLLQHRALIRLDEDLVRLADQEDYTVIATMTTLRNTRANGRRRCTIHRVCRVLHVQSAETAGRHKLASSWTTLKWTCA